MDKLLLERVFKEQQFEFNTRPVEVERQLNSSQLYSGAEITTITGVRRCGKSTLLRQISLLTDHKTQILYLGFDDPRLTDFDAKDFEVVYQIWLASLSHKKTQHLLLFDEIQNIKGWERWADYFSKRPHTKVVVTGSNATLLSSELSTLLTGRHQELALTPFSYQEIFNSNLKPKNIDDPVLLTSLKSKLLATFAEYGGFPRVFLDKKITLLNQYYSDIVERDILPRLKRASPRYVNQLAILLAAESTRLFNRSKTARVLGVKDQVTIGKYCDTFVATFLYKELRSFSPSVRRQLRSLSKFYCVDHALAREVGYSSGTSSSNTLELMVFMELLRRNKNLFYWHSKEGFEVDLLLVDKRNPIIAIQVAENIGNQEVRNREVRALMAAKKQLGVKELLIVTLEEEYYLEDFGIRVIPFHNFALNTEIS